MQPKILLFCIITFKWQTYSVTGCGNNVNFISNALTLKWLGHFFQNVISFSDAVHLMCNIFIWNWFSTMNVYSALWILMAISSHSADYAPMRFPVFKGLMFTFTFSESSLFSRAQQSYFLISINIWKRPFTILASEINEISWDCILRWTLTCIPHTIITVTTRIPADKNTYSIIHNEWFLIHEQNLDILSGTD